MVRLLLLDEALKRFHTNRKTQRPTLTLGTSRNLAFLLDSVYFKANDYDVMSSASCSFPEKLKKPVWRRCAAII